jgi:hypothetical protein
MGHIENQNSDTIATFNGPVEIGLRALVILTNTFPKSFSLQRLLVYDYLLVHSDDIPDGPPGIHPKTPHRSGELLVKRRMLQKGLLLFQSRNLIEQVFSKEGIEYRATETSAAFLDILRSNYVRLLKERALWVNNTFAELSDTDLRNEAYSYIDKWGAEFEYESDLWLEDSE